MVHSNESTLKETILQILKKYALEEKLDEKRLIHSWDDITGSMISKYTKDLYIKNQKLFVKIDSPALKNELIYARTKLMEKLNESVGKEVIREIIFL